MPYLSRADRARAEWRTLSEAVAHICKADNCNQTVARQQLQQALADGVLSPLRWADGRPAPRVGGATVLLDDPLASISDGAEIEWEAGTVRDEWGETRPLLIHRLALREYWPEMYPRAGREDEDRYEAQQTRLMRAARQNREAADAAWQAAWDAERAKPRRQRQYFSFGEFADFLARDPRTLAVDEGLRARILSDLTDWVLQQQFDLASGEVATLTGDPPSFEPFAPPAVGTIITAPEGLMLRRDASRRYIEENAKLENAADLLRQWFGLLLGDPGTAEAGAASGDVIASDELRMQPRLAIEKKTLIPKRTLLKHLQDIKATDQPIPAADRLYAEVVKAFPGHHVTRQDVRMVHQEVWGQQSPGRRRQK